MVGVDLGGSLGDFKIFLVAHLIHSVLPSGEQLACIAVTVLLSDVPFSCQKE